MNKVLLAGYAVLSLSLFCAPAFAAPSAASSVNPAAGSTDTPYKLAQMQNEISALQAQVKALRSNTAGTTENAVESWDNGDLSNIPSGG